MQVIIIMAPVDARSGGGRTVKPYGNCTGPKNAKRCLESKTKQGRLPNCWFFVARLLLCVQLLLSGARPVTSGSICTKYETATGAFV